MVAKGILKQFWKSNPHNVQRSHKNAPVSVLSCQRPTLLYVPEGRHRDCGICPLQGSTERTVVFVPCRALLKEQLSIIQSELGIIVAEGKHGWPFAVSYVDTEGDVISVCEAPEWEDFLVASCMPGMAGKTPRITVTAKLSTLAAEPDLTNVPPPPPVDLPADPVPPPTPTDIPPPQDPPPPVVDVLHESAADSAAAKPATGMLGIVCVSEPCGISHTNTAPIAVSRFVKKYQLAEEATYWSNMGGGGSVHALPRSAIMYVVHCCQTHRQGRPGCPIITLAQH